VGTAAAAIIIREKRIVSAFRRVGATTSAAAVAPETIGVSEHFAFRHLRRHAVLREAGPGRYYLDEPSWEAWRLLRRRLVLVAIGLGLIALLGLWRAVR
jgi:hypothetical protein